MFGKDLTELGCRNLGPLHPVVDVRLEAALTGDRHSQPAFFLRSLSATAELWPSRLFRSRFELWEARPMSSGEAQVNLRPLSKQPINS